MSKLPSPFSMLAQQLEWRTHRLPLELFMSSLVLSTIVTLCSINQASASNLSFNFDNDFVFKTDEDYTGGFRLSYYDDLPVNNTEQDETALLSLPLFIEDPYQTTYTRWGVSLGQKVWTPTYLNSEQPLANERPYAGLLYAEGSLVKLYSHSAYQLSLLTGVVGPNSYAKDTQTLVHRVLESRAPKGWDNQIQQEVVANLSLKANVGLNSYDSQIPFIPELALNNRALYGNFRSEVASGILMRWGSSLDNSFGSSEIRNADGINIAAVRRPINSAYLYAGVEARYRFNDITIDGKLTDDTYRVDIEHWQSTAVIGAVLQRKNYGISLSVAHKSKDFEQSSVDSVRNVSLSLFWLL